MTKSNEHGDNPDDNPGDNRKDKPEDPQESSRLEPSEGGDGCVKPEPQPGAEPGSRRDRVGTARTSPLVWLALLVASAALALASYPFWTDWLAEPDAVQESGPSASDFQRLVERVDTLGRDSSAKLEKLGAELDRLSSDLAPDAQGPDVGALVERVDQLSSRLDRLQGERNTALSGLRARVEEAESEVGSRLEQFERRLESVGSDLDQADRD